MSITARIDQTTLVTPDYWQAECPAPRSVKIEVSPRCNYRCGFCALRTRERQPRTDMDFALFQRITREMREAGVEEIGVFYLGESFMNPGLLVDCIRHCKALGFPYVFLTTNGSLCEIEHIKAVFEAGLDSLKFSCNAADEAQFAEVMGVSPKYFRKAIQAIRDARRIRDEGGYKCGLYASSIRYDGEQHARMESFLAENVIPFVDEHYWLPLYSMGSIATQREAELGYRPTAGNQGRLGALRDPLPCWSAFTEGHVRADGGLSLCCFDSDGRHFMPLHLLQVGFLVTLVAHVRHFLGEQLGGVRSVRAGAGNTDAIHHRLMRGLRAGELLLHVLVTFEAQLARGLAEQLLLVRLVRDVARGALAILPATFSISHLVSMKRAAWASVEPQNYLAGHERMGLP